jgi:hypothetical protein
VHDRIAASSGVPDRGQVQQLVSSAAVEANDLVTGAREISGNRIPDMPKMSRD